MKKKKGIDKIGFSSAIIMCITLIYLFIESIYKILKTGNVFEASWEIVLLLIMVLLFGFLNKDEVAYDIPKSLLGLPLPFAKNKTKERLNIYLLDGMVFALFLCLVNTYVYVFMSPDKALLLFRVVDGFELYNLLVNLVIFFLLITGVFFTIDNYISERNIKIYLEYLKNLTKLKEQYNLNNDKTEKQKKTR